MVNERRISNTLFKAMKESMRFEEFMDKTDFNSWFYKELEQELVELNQEIRPYHEFVKNIDEMQNICLGSKDHGTKELPKQKAGEDFEKWLIYQLFDAKSKRLEARKVPKGKILLKFEEQQFEEAANQLHIALSELRETEFKEDIWAILFYNDLSICYSGVKNSALSKGYADKALTLIEKNIQELNSKQEITGHDNVKNNLINSTLHELYLIAIYNRAIAENYSELLSEAEESFGIIIDNDDCDSLKFNYQSAILNLGRIFIDQGRGKEATELLEELLPINKDKSDNDKNKSDNDKNKLLEDDVRYWDAFLQYVSSLIDQAQYKSAKEKLLEKFFENDENWHLIARHKITFQGFSALNCLFRCTIEELKSKIEIENSMIKNAQKIADIITTQIENMEKREQTEPKLEAYKYLGVLYALLAKECKDKSGQLELNKKSVENFLCSIGPKKIGLDDFCTNENDRADIINKCNDSNLLFTILCIICETDNLTTKLTDECLNDILWMLHIKIEKLCNSKSELHRIKQCEDKICERQKIKNENLPLEEKSIVQEIDHYFFKNQGLEGKIIRQRLDTNEKRFDNVLFGRSNFTHCEIEKILAELVILRRWNSFSPGLFRRDAMGSLGGGYLIRIKTKDKRPENIVIDPGYNFLQNFSNEKFSIEDLDTIIVTHAHLDHCADLLPIMDLIFQINKRYGKCPKRDEETKKKRINLCLSKAAYKRFNSHIKDWEEQLTDVVILENLKSSWSPIPDVEISATKTPHYDLAGENAIGIKIKSKNDDFCFGITGDTPYYSQLGDFFAECDILCLHLGAIKHAEIGYNDEIYETKEGLRKISGDDIVKEFKKTFYKSDHLLFWGTKKLISDCNQTKSKEKLVIVGEFGEELKYSLRTDLCSKLSEKDNLRCLPGDIGLYVKVEKENGVVTKKIRCNFCEEFVEKEDIRTFPYERGDSIQYICASCCQTLSELQKQSIIEHRESQDIKYN
ncbi:MAG: MBL fold metallo-hydrolase [Candidatus Bathyarchaeia archaeon]